MTEKVDRSTTDPFGNEYTILPSRRYPGLLEIRCETRPENWRKPKEIEGYFTGKDKALQFLNAYLVKAWEYSDAEAEKNAKRAATKSIKKTEDAPATAG